MLKICHKVQKQLTNCCFHCAQSGERNKLNFCWIKISKCSKWSRKTHYSDLCCPFYWKISTRAFVPYASSKQSSHITLWLCVNVSFLFWLCQNVVIFLDSLSINVKSRLISLHLSCYPYYCLPLLFSTADLRTSPDQWFVCTHMNHDTIFPWTK